MSVRHIHARSDEYIAVHRNHTSRRSSSSGGGGDGGIFFLFILWVTLGLLALYIVSQILLFILAYWYIFLGAGLLFLGIRYRAKLRAVVVKICSAIGLHKKSSSVQASVANSSVSRSISEVYLEEDSICTPGTVVPATFLQQGRITQGKSNKNPSYGKIIQNR